MVVLKILGSANPNHNTDPNPNYNHNPYAFKQNIPVPILPNYIILKHGVPGAYAYRVHTHDGTPHDWARLRRNSTVANKSAHTVTTAPSRPGDSLKPLDR